MLRIRQEPTSHAPEPESSSSHAPFIHSFPEDSNTFMPSGKRTLNTLKHNFNYGRVSLPTMDDPFLERAWRETLLQFLLWFGIGLLSLLGIGFFGVQWLADHTPNGVRIAFEKAIATVFEKDLQAHIIPPKAYTKAQAESIAHLEGLLKKLQAHELDDERRYPLPIRLTLQRTPYPNAFAVPGGQMIVTTGLLRLAKTLKHQHHDALGFIVAHELGHFRHRDHLKGLGWKVFSICILAPLEATESIGFLTENQYSQWQETLADDYAMALTQRIHLNPKAGMTFFKVMAKATPPEDWSDTLLSDHPPTKARIKHLEAWYQQYQAQKTPLQKQTYLLHALR
ncbi:MAG: M48 family metallopeptidase [Vampirovibrionales bacterium]